MLLTQKQVFPAYFFTQPVDNDSVRDATAPHVGPAALTSPTAPVR